MNSISLKGWLIIAVMVIAGGVLEYWWMVGFARLDRRWGHRQKMLLGAVLIAITVAGLSYGIIRFYHP